MVGELRLGDQLPPARRSVHPTKRRRRRPGAARSRQRRGHVHEEPDQRRGRTNDRGELGARRGGRRRGMVIPDHFRIDRSGPGARAHARPQEDRRPRRFLRAVRSRRSSHPRSPSSSASRTFPTRGSAPPGRAVRGDLRSRDRDIEWAFADGNLLPLAVPCRHAIGIVTVGGIAT